MASCKFLPSTELRSFGKQIETVWPTTVGGSHQSDQPARRGAPPAWYAISITLFSRLVNLSNKVISIKYKRHTVLIAPSSFNCDFPLWIFAKELSQQRLFTTITVIANPPRCHHSFYTEAVNSRCSYHSLPLSINYFESVRTSCYYYRCFKTCFDWWKVISNWNGLFS